MCAKSLTPLWKTETLHSPLTQFALPLISYYHEKWVASGTAVVIAPCLAITARHVIEDHWAAHHLTPLENGQYDGSFVLQIMQIVKGTGILWDARRLWLSPHTDIAFISLSPSSSLPENFIWETARLDLRPLQTGQEVFCFGYRASKASFLRTESTRPTLEWYDEPTITTGEILEIHDSKRDSSRLKFPCFRTNARFDGGMSGGPVFTTNGSLRGLICSSMPPSQENEEHTSYVALLWPMMGTMLDFCYPNSPAGSYPALELARQHIINALGWQNITLIPKDDGPPTVALSVDKNLEYQALTPTFGWLR